MLLGLGLPQSSETFTWDARAAEHLLNRAGFGATPVEIEAAVQAGLEATVERLIAPTGDAAKLPRTQFLRGGVPMPEVMDTGPAFADPLPILTIENGFYADKGVLRKLTDIRAYSSDWIGAMVEGEHPLRDKLTIFWHGHFVSSLSEVSLAEDMIRQVSFLRENALGDLGTLVRGVARDPAMLEYLNNDINVKAAPNENWARELMELFLLGEGNYTEDDIKGAARAFTGWTRRDHAFVDERNNHDYGPKTIVGITGNLNGDAVIDLLLADDQCGRFLAWKLIRWFEGADPAPERVEHYGQLFRESGYQIDGFMRQLLTDPEFYREEVRGNRIAAPVEYFAGMTRRLGQETPPDMLYIFAALAGQQLFAPPNVKGWNEGISWLTTNSVMQRSNYVGIMLGEYDRELRPEVEAKKLIKNQGRALNRPYRDYLAMVNWMNESDWAPEFLLSGVLAPHAQLGDEAAVDLLLEHLLAVPRDPATAAGLVELLAELRSENGVETALLAPGAEALLEQLVHVIISLPEAQLL